DHSEQSIHSLPRYLQKRRTLISRLVGHGQLPAAEWFDPRYTNRLTFPEWRLLWEYLIGMKYASLAASQRAACGLSVLRRQFSHGNYARMIRDFLLAGDKWLAQTLRPDVESVADAPSQPRSPRAAA